MALLRWGFESGTQGDALSATNANADFVVATGGSAAISTAQSIEGTRSAYMNATSASGGVYIQKNLPATPQLGVDAFFYVTALPSSEVSVIWLGDGTTRLCSVNLMTDGKIIIRDGGGGGGSNAWLSSSTLALNTWYRLSFFATQGVTDGKLRAAFYAGNSTTPLADSGLLSAQNAGASQYTGFRVGAKATSNTVTAAAYLDNYGYDSAATGLLPVASAPGASAVVASPVGVVDATASTGTGLTYGISQTSGPAKSATVLAPGKWAIPVDVSQDTVWLVAVTQSDDQVKTTSVTIPSANAHVPPVEMLYATAPGVFV